MKNNSYLPLVHRLLLPTIILIFTLIYFLEVQALPDPRNGLLINPIFWIMVVLYPLIIWQEWKKFKDRNKEETSQVKTGVEEAEEAVDSDTDTRLTKKLLSYMVGIAAYLAFVEYVGFVIMTLIFLPVMMRILGTKSKKLLIFIPIAVVLIIYFVFIEALGIRFPVWPNF